MKKSPSVIAPPGWPAADDRSGAVAPTITVDTGRPNPTIDFATLR
jgi:hypothetical protein